MSVDLRGSDILVAEQVLNCSDIIAVFQQVGGKAVTKSVAGGWFGKSRHGDGRFHGPLYAHFMKMMAAHGVRPRIFRKRRSREDILPAPLFAGLWIFAGQSKREVNIAMPCAQVALMDQFYPLKVTLQTGADFLGQHRQPVLGSFPIMDRDLIPLEIDVFHPESKTFQQPHAGAIKELGNQLIVRSERRQELLSFRFAKDNREFTRSCRSFYLTNLSQFHAQDGPIKENDRIERLVLSSGGDIPCYCQVIEIRLHFRRSQLAGMSFTMEKDKIFDPDPIRFLRSDGQMLEAHDLPELFAKL